MGVAPKRAPSPSVLPGRARQHREQPCTADPRGADGTGRAAVLEGRGQLSSPGAAARRRSRTLGSGGSGPGLSDPHLFSTGRLATAFVTQEGRGALQWGWGPEQQGRLPPPPAPSLPPTPISLLPLTGSGRPTREAASRVRLGTRGGRQDQGDGAYLAGQCQLWSPGCAYGPANSAGDPEDPGVSPKRDLGAL